MSETNGKLLCVDVVGRSDVNTGGMMQCNDGAVDGYNRM